MDCIRLRLSAGSTSIIVRENWLVIESSNPAELERGLQEICGNKLLSVPEIAERTGFTAAAVRGWLKAKRLSGVIIGKEYRVREEDLQKFLQNDEPRHGKGRRRKIANL